MPIRLRPTNPMAAEAILVGDPGRALALAQSLLVEPKMSNHARGLWGYTSNSIDGKPLTIQSTGMGGPSAIGVLTDLVALGARRAVRVGTCRSLGPVGLGDPVVARLARSLDGARLGDVPGIANDIPPPGEGLTAALREQVGAEAVVMSLYEDPAREPELDLLSLREREAPECEVADMQTAALFATGHRHRIEVAAVLVPEWSASGGRLDPEHLEAAVDRAAQAALAALSTVPQPQV